MEDYSRHFSFSTDNLKIFIERKGLLSHELVFAMLIYDLSTTAPNPNFIPDPESGLGLAFKFRNKANVSHFSFILTTQHSMMYHAFMLVEL